MLLELRQIEKRFGGVTALRGAGLAVGEGEVHLLLGENGAGKSTLMKIVAGMTARDGGEMFWRGRPVWFRNPAQAAADGIAMVHQESLLAPHLSVAENIFLGREERRPFGWVNRRRMREQAQRLIERHGFPLDAGWRVERLSPAGRQLVEICRAIQHGSSLLIFDEPTSALSGAETRAVFDIVGALSNRGVGVVYITHRLEETRAIGDRVTILRDGAVVFTGPLSGLDSDVIIRHMVGRDMSAVCRRRPLPPGDELLRVENLSRPPVLAGIHLSLRAGEITGLAGLAGAGRTELCRTLFGAAPAAAGRVFVGGREIRLRSPRDAVAAGIALIPEDRQRTGLATGLPLSANLTLAALEPISPFGFLNRRAELRLTADYMSRLRIRAGSPRQAAGRLSGGNQQKVAIAKWLARGARVLLFDEPTRGIDVGAKAEVFQVMDELARSGAAILMVSSELPELIQVADRILVMRQGRIAAELRGTATQEEILRHAALEGAAAP